MKPSSRAAIAIGVALGAMLTAFYYVHEGLPRAIRAPTALLLAPVAVVDGLCYYLGIPGIYGKTIPVFVVNCGVGISIWLGVRFLWSRWRGPGAGKRMTPFPSSDDFLEAVQDLLARLDAGGHAAAAAEMRSGQRLDNGLTDGRALFLQSIEAVRATYAKQFTAVERADLERIRQALETAVYRR